MRERLREPPGEPGEPLLALAGRQMRTSKRSIRTSFDETSRAAPEFLKVALRSSGQCGKLLGGQKPSTTRLSGSKFLSGSFEEALKVQDFDRSKFSIGSTARRFGSELSLGS